ncbi:hypothetical protein WAE56_01540 [Iodobacter sp. LRB]|uniref:hypothetical protein n=1 Tax=unclassified Iodobacter TaxID=235634 RepID=UPI000C0E29D0|nr:hypothetical protein [Iodobacter sp. BJB302]PHV01522.1 hypothetical protein CSQ88_11790 [Iodobacter sp. BJB302]
MSINIDFWQALSCAAAVFVFFFGLLISLLKVLFKQFEDRQSARFTQIETSLIKRDDDFTRLERDWLKHLAELPIQYVRREDYIRGQSVLEAKLDALYSKVELNQFRGTSHD